MGIKNYINFLCNKFQRTYGGGIFFMGFEGDGPFYMEDTKDNIFNAFIVDTLSPWGYHYLPFYYTCQALWIIVLLMCGLPVFFKTDHKNFNYITVLRITLLGVFLYLIIFETRSRQLVMWLPIFITLASGSFKRFFNTVNKYIRIKSIN